MALSDTYLRRQKEGESDDAYEKYLKDNHMQWKAAFSPPPSKEVKDEVHPSPPNPVREAEMLRHEFQGTHSHDPYYPNNKKNKES
jgi:hypothetical protein